MSDRVRRLEGRIAPPANAIDPAVDAASQAHLRLAEIARHDLDQQDREHSDRLDHDASAAPPPLTLEERKYGLALYPRWLEYLREQRRMAEGTSLVEIISDAIERSRASAARLETEIATMEGVDE